MSESPAACTGCTGCAMRCTDGIKISAFEYQRIVEDLRAQDPAYAYKVLEQDKEIDWFEGISYTACLFLDIDSSLCLIYPARPLVCRLFGRVKHLPCPEGLVPADIDARRIIQAHVSQTLHTFQEWMAESGSFNFHDLIGTPYDPPRIEI